MSMTAQANATAKTGFGHTQCPYCGASMKGGHVCPKRPADTDPSDLSDERWAGYAPTGTPFDQVDLEARKDALYAGRRVSPSYISHAPGSPDDFWGEWYGRVASWGERNDAGYLKMPDDYTPSMTGGRASTGNRHTHRMRYSTPDGFEIRMPSATSIRRFASDEAMGQTFEVPVAYTTKDGGQGMVSVLATWNGPGAWTIQAPAGDARFGRVTEAVASVLEARRPSVALATVGDLNQRRRERIMRTGSPIIAPRKPSHFVTGVSQIGDKGAVVVRIDNGKGERLYGYHVRQNTPQARSRLINRLMGRTGESVGQAFNSELKGQSRVEVAQCPRCKCVYEVEVGHQCRLMHAAPRRTESDADRLRRDTGWADAVAASYRRR